MLASFAGYAIYLAGLNQRLVEPNRASWLIWGSATAIEAVTYAAVNPGTPQSIVFLVSAVACLTVALALWRRSRWSAPDAVESVCMGVSLTAIVLWLVFREAFWAHMIVVAAVPISFWPTWRSVWVDRARERSPAWGLWTVGDLATLLLATRTGSQDVGEYAYIVVELVCHASVWFMIGLPTINPLRSFGWREGRLRVLDAYAPAVNPFSVGANHLGKAVFARVDFMEGETIVRFSGRRIAAARVPRKLLGRGDRFLQIARDQYLGPSGAIDDLINHHCAPNAGLRFMADGVFLIAARDIVAGEEINWDYSTTLSDGGWTMKCECGAAACRGTIAAFDTLPPDRQDWYRARNLVAPYLRGDAKRAEKVA
ncbi:SET domain-containing protein [Sphingomonas sp. SUN019]|uniref:SET domain-containing protein n=1 Tax=Sphingomonas sp. SUN019 TaxID=2937788 RepID=UPI0021644451|nr:SET domain-containing protein [Sphingomonas sp. SUN019]UVO52371.1 SET domain-containing protein [Sphingomonas sp. SUN019]